jgi:hypothetical protein
MANQGTAEEKPARAEAAVREYRRTRRRWTRRTRNLLILLTVVTVALLPCCCCWYAVFGIVKNYPARVVMRLTKYPNAQLISKDTYVGGNDLVYHYWYIYWTKDSVSDVIDHYEKFFPQFEQVGVPFAWKEKYPGKGEYPMIFESDYDPVDMIIYVEDADQTNRRFDWVWAIPIPDDVPRTGTVFMIAFWADSNYD